MHINSFHPDAPALINAVHAFGGGTTSRLWMRIREQGGMAYQVGAGLGLSAQGLRSTLSMLSSCSAEQMNDVHAAMEQEWEHFVKNGITLAEMENAKEQRALHHQSEIQNDAGYVGVYHSAPVTQKDYIWRADFQKAESALTLAQVNTAITTHFSKLPLQWALARSIRSLDACENSDNSETGASL
jgi:zinc protease